MAIQHSPHLSTLTPIMAQYQHEHLPIETSAVVVLKEQQNRPTLPPPSPPSDPASQPESPCPSIDNLSLDDNGVGKATRLANGLHVLEVEANALRNLAGVYGRDTHAQEQFSNAVEAIAKSMHASAKLVVIGVGKSGHIGRKLTATFQSLGVSCVFLHPTEALHGDLGIVGPSDTILFITFSGKSPELLSLAPHVPVSSKVIVLTSHMRANTCELLRRRPDGILLSAPIPEPEKLSFGVSAPTTSTTVSLALGDALAMAAAKELHTDVGAVFSRNHPGGAIGAPQK